MILRSTLAAAFLIVSLGGALAKTTPTAHPHHAMSHRMHSARAMHATPVSADHSADSLNAQSLQRAQGQ